MVSALLSSGGDFAVNDWGDISAVAGILAVVFGVLAWLLKIWLDKQVRKLLTTEVTPHLTNDGTSAATYAHQAAEAAIESKEASLEAKEAALAAKGAATQARDAAVSVKEYLTKRPFDPAVDRDEDVGDEWWRKGC